MEQAEVFHIYHQGEQRGPYSVRQVNHLYRCGYICDDTLYWRDGMEQWQPVTEIVERRMQRKRLRRWAITAAVFVFLAVLIFLFGPVTRDAWRELTSGEYTSDSAWWRARGIIREKLSDGEHVEFDARPVATVQLAGNNSAIVILGGNVTDAHDKVAHVSWTLHLQFDPERRLWQASIPEPAPAAPAPLAPPAPVPAAPEIQVAPPGPGPVGETQQISNPAKGATASAPTRNLAPE